MLLIANCILGNSMLYPLFMKKDLSNQWLDTHTLHEHSTEY